MLSFLLTSCSSYSKDTDTPSTTNMGSIYFRGVPGNNIRLKQFQNALYVIHWENGSPVCKILSDAKEDVRRIYRYSDNATNKIEGFNRIDNTYFIKSYTKDNASSKHIEISSHKTKYQNIPQGQFSSNGNNLIFASSLISTRTNERGTHYSDIYSLNPKSGELLQLTNQGQNLAPAVSPDGKWIAFYSFPEMDLLDDATDSHVTTNFQLVLMNIIDRKTITLNSAPYRLHDYWDKPPTWSPDGKYILFHRTNNPDNPPELFLIEINAKKSSKIADIAVWPSWSPQGTWIVYSKPRKDGKDICKLDIKNKNEIILISDNKENTHPTWSPDGSWICFIKHTPNKSEKDLYIMNTSGDHVQVLVQDLLIQDQTGEFYWISDNK